MPFVTPDSELLFIQVITFDRLAAYIIGMSYLLSVGDASHALILSGLRLPVQEREGVLVDY